MTEIDYAGGTHHEGEPESSFSVATVVHILRSYAVPILLTILAAALGYGLLATAYMLMQPTQRRTTLGFRLEFAGAEGGRYPNGVRFSSSDITDSAVLRAVYDANQLARYMSFNTFSESVVALESNAALDQLARQYSAKLADPKLSAVDRERFESEYAQKRDSLPRNEFALSFTTREGVKVIPTSVIEKTLSDILTTWAEFASKTRQVLVHRVPLVSKQAVMRAAADDPDVFASLLALRSGARELRHNVIDLAALPGAEVIRSASRKASLREVDMELAQVERSGMEFLLTAVLRSGVVDRERATALLEARLDYDKRALGAAEERVRVLRNALEIYTGGLPGESPRQRPDLTDALPRRDDSDSSRGRETESVLLSDTILERIVALAQDAADRDYRQRRVDDIRSASLDVVPLRSVVEYDQNLLQAVRGGGATVTMTMPDVMAARQRISTQLATIATDLEEIRAILSRSLNASGQIYTITAPAVDTAESNINMRRITLGGILVAMLAFVAGVAGAFLHHKLLAERSHNAAA
jgi:hypothetical protein